jgi:hypothetical protein
VASHRAIAKARYSVAGSATKYVSYSLTSFGRELLASRHGRRLTVTLLATTTDGNRLVKRLVLR